MCISDRRAEVVVVGVTEIGDREANAEERLARLKRTFKLGFETISVRSVKVQVALEPTSRSEDALAQRSAALEEKRTQCTVPELSGQLFLVEESERVDEHNLQVGYVDADSLAGSELPHEGDRDH